MSNRPKLRRVLKRDRRLCGVHMGGCGRPIVIGEPATRDHIVPTALYSKVASEAEFDQPWNWQPMHKECNEAKGSALDEWPRFDCDCHYLQIHGRDLYVHTKDPAGGGRHKLLENVVSDEDARVDARLVAGEGAVKGVGPIFGYWRGKAGYLFPGIARSRVQLFNLTERGTVGLPVPETVQLDDAGRVVGRWGTARSVRRRSTSAETRFRRGHCLAELGRLQEALEEFAAAVREEPSMAKAYWRRGVAKAKLARLEEALADLDRAIRLDPNVAEAYFDRGVTKNCLGRDEEAIPDYDQATRIRPSYREALRNRALSKLRLGRPEEAITDFDEEIQHHPDAADAYFQRALAKGKLGWHSESIADYDEEIRITPGESAAYCNRGSAKGLLGDHEGAVADLAQALALKPGDAKALHNRAVSLRKLGRLREAATDAEAAAALCPGRAEIHYNLGCIRLNLGETDEARANLEAALELASGGGNEKLIALATDTLAWVERANASSRRV